MHPSQGLDASASNANEEQTTIEKQCAILASEYALSEIKKREVQAGPPGKSSGGINLSGMRVLTFPDAATFKDPTPAHFLVQERNIYVSSPSETDPNSGLKVCCPVCDEVACFSGWTPKARTVINFTGADYILSRKYICKPCGGEWIKVASCCKLVLNIDAHFADAKKALSKEELEKMDKEKRPTPNFNSCTARFLEKLPWTARSQLPAVVTHRAAILLPVLELVKRNVINGKSFQDESDALHELHRVSYYQSMRAYYEYYKEKAARDDSDAGQTKIRQFFKPIKKAIEHFPLLDASAYRSGMGSQYLIELYLAEARARWLYQARRLCSLGGKVQAGDHTFKTAKNVTSPDGARSFEAVWDMVNEYNQVVCLIFTSSKSLDEIAPFLRELNDAWEAAGALMPEYMWVDDSTTSTNALKNAFPSLKLILEDATHGMRRYARSLPDGHSATALFMADLSKAFFEAIPEDVAAIKDQIHAAGKWGEAGSKEREAAERLVRRKARHFIPPPEQLAKRVQAVMDKYATTVDPLTNITLLGDATWKVHEAQMKLIWDGKYSDPLGVNEMFMKIEVGKQTKFIGLRGTSRLEGFHNHLKGVIQGNRASPELAGALISDFVNQWNIDPAISNIPGTVNYGIYDMEALEQINNLCESLGLSKRFPELKHAPVLAKIPEQFTAMVPKELLCAFQPEEGPTPLLGADIDEDAAMAIRFFETDLPRLISRPTAALPAQTATAVSTGNVDDAVPAFNLVSLPSAAAAAAVVAVNTNVPALSPVAAATTLVPTTTAGIAVPATATANGAAAATTTTYPSTLFPAGASGPLPATDAVAAPPAVSTLDVVGDGGSTPTGASFGIASAPSPRVTNNTRKRVHPHSSRSPGSKRKPMPVDYAEPVKSPGEKALMMEVIGNKFTSGAMKLSATHREVAGEFNARVTKMVMENPQRAANFTFKRAGHVAEFASQETTALATANCRAQAEATLASMQQQGASEEEQIQPMQTHALAIPSQPSHAAYFSAGASTAAGRQARAQRKAIIQNKKVQRAASKRQGEQLQSFQPEQMYAMQPPPPSLQLPLLQQQPGGEDLLSNYFHLAYTAGLQAAAGTAGLIGGAVFQQAGIPPVPHEPEKKKYAGRGGPGKKRYCQQCKKPLEGRGKVEGACSCEKKRV